MAFGLGSDAPSRLALGLAAVVGLLVLYASPVVSAQGSERRPGGTAEQRAGRHADGARVTVVRQTQERMDRLADAVDPVLLRELARTAGVVDPSVSPIDFGEIRLAAGCSDETAPCLAAIAGALDVEAILLRQIDRRGDGRTRITLVHHVRSSADAPARVTYSSRDEDELVRNVPRLVRRLFGIPDAPHAESDGPSIGAATWLSLGSGVVLLSIASVLGIMANDAHDTYASLDVQTTDDAERAVDALSAAEDRALAANVLFAAGGIALGIGATFLVLDLTGDRDDDEGRPRSLALMPVRDGAMVMLSGSIGDM